MNDYGESLELADILESRRLHRELQDPIFGGEPAPSQFSGEPVPLFVSDKNAGVDGREVSVARKPAASERDSEAA